MTFYDGYVIGVKDSLGENVTPMTGWVIPMPK